MPLILNSKRVVEDRRFGRIKQATKYTMRKGQLMIEHSFPHEELEKMEEPRRFMAATLRAMRSELNKARGGARADS